MHRIIRVSVHISIHALREESDSCTRLAHVRIQSISIHALREESDASRHVQRNAIRHFNPRSP